jgi:hypothetical protein
MQQLRSKLFQGQFGNVIYIGELVLIQICYNKTNAASIQTAAFYQTKPKFNLYKLAFTSPQVNMFLGK